MRTTALIAIAATLTTCYAQAQPRGPREGEAGSPPLFYEAVTLPPAGDSVQTRIDVHYRVDREFFIPVRDQDAEAGIPFHRRGEILVELVDTTGSVEGRAMDDIDIPEKDAEVAAEGREWNEGILSIAVSPGTYKIQLTMDDLESRRHYLDSSRSVHTPAVQATGLATASPMLIEPPQQDTGGVPSTVVPLNYGGGILFGRSSALLLAWRSPSQAESTLTVSSTWTTPSQGDQPLLPPTQEATVKVLRGIALRADPEKMLYRLTRGATGTASVAFVALPTAQLLLRPYTLTLSLRCGAEKREIVMKPRAIWPTMPFSLKDIDYALEALKYITTETQLDSLRRGNLETRRNSLEEFWRAKNTTPGKALNEVMAEYYRRVDYAVRTFGTLRQPDGFRSDRGRIYILYGPPTATDRTLDPETGFQEVWVYERQKKKFVFVDQNKSGNYILVSTTTL